MLEYPELADKLQTVVLDTSDVSFNAEVIPYLTKIWIADYTSSLEFWDVVEVPLEGFSYLFDITPGRLIAAWGLSRGPNTEGRDKSRMAGHPLSAGSEYHRGHAIPHSLGGITDINLVPQLGAVNIGAFRPLERKAVATPGSLYFTYWSYLDPTSQTPHAVEQGLLIPGMAPDIRTHKNL